MKTLYHTVIELLTLKNVQPLQMHNPMTAVYGNDVPSYATVKRWAAEFYWGRTSLEDEPPSGHPSEAICEINRRAVENVVLQNRQVNVCQIAGIKDISSGFIRRSYTNTCRWQKSVRDGFPECLTRKWKIVDAKYQVKIWNAYSWTGICLCSAY